MRKLWLWPLLALALGAGPALADQYASLKERCRAGNPIDCDGLILLANERCEEENAAACQDLIDQAQSGSVEAQYRLGLILAVGRGQPQSLTSARQWLRRASDHGHEWARQWFQHPPDAIQGAFGFKLGQRFEPPAGAKPERTAIGDRYRVTPASPVHPFDTYFVTVTPQGGLIHTISAEADLQKYPAQQQFAYAHLRLQKEFWTQPQETRRIYEAHVDFVSQDGRSVRLYIIFHTVYVDYLDGQLREQGRAEMREIEAQGAGPSR